MQKKTPFGVATRVRRNCSTIEKFEERSTEYQNYLVDRDYHPSKVKRPKIHPGRTSFHLKNERKRLFFPLWLILTHICPTLVKSLSLLAISFMSHPLLHRFFPKGQSSHLIEGPKTSKSSYRDSGDLTIVTTTILLQVVLNVAKNVIYVRTF